MSVGKSSGNRSEAVRIVNPRRNDRITTSGITCELGVIVDLSETGMRIVGKPKTRLDIGTQLRLSVGSEIQRLSVTGQVVWIKKPGWKWFRPTELGVKFIGLKPAAGKALVELAKYGFVQIPASDAGSGSASGTQSSHAQTNDAASQTKTQPHNRVGASVQIENYYEAIGVGTTATFDEIHAAFRSLAKQLHPDVNKSAEAEQRFVFIAKAYATLRDPLKRAEYDRKLSGSPPRKAA